MTTLGQGAMVGDYQIMKKIGAGGMGECYLASMGAQEGGELVVLKLVLCGNKADAREALQEAKALREISHPNVVRYLDVFPREEAVQGIISVVTVMEHCSRGDLGDYLGNLRAKQRHGVPQSVVMAWYHRD